MKKLILLIPFLFILQGCSAGTDLQELSTLNEEQTKKINELENMNKGLDNKISVLEELLLEAIENNEEVKKSNTIIRSDISNNYDYLQELELKLEGIELIQFLDNNLDRTLQLKTFKNSGFTDDELYALTQEEVDFLFSPGTHWDGAGIHEVLTNDEVIQLEKKSLDFDEIERLNGMGYSIEDLLSISKEEIDFIFPIENLANVFFNYGYAPEQINIRLAQGETYEDLVKEALKLN